MIRLAFIFLAGVVAVSGQVRTVYVTAPDSHITSGDTMTLAAAAADANGNVMPNAAITWSSSSDAILSVDKTGVVFHPLADEWRKSSDLGVNYMVLAEKPKAV